MDKKLSNILYLVEFENPPAILHQKPEQQLMQIADAVEDKAPKLGYRSALEVIAPIYSVDPDKLANFLEQRARLIQADSTVPFDQRLTALRAAGKFIEASNLQLAEISNNINTNALLYVGAIRDMINAGKPHEALSVGIQAQKSIDLSYAPLIWASVQHQYARALYNNDKYEDAEKIIREVIRVRTKLLGPDNDETLSSRNVLANILDDRLSFAAAEKENIEVLLKQVAKYGGEAPITLRSKNNLAEVHRHQRKLDLAIDEHRKILEIRMRSLGPDDIETLSSRNNLAAALFENKQFGESESQHRITFDAYKKILGSKHPLTLASQSNLAEAIQEQGRWDYAKHIHLEVLAGFDATAPDTSNVYNSCYNIALCYKQESDFMEARKYALRAAEGWEKIHGPIHPYTIAARDLVKSLPMNP